MTGTSEGFLILLQVEAIIQVNLSPQMSQIVKRWSLAKNVADQEWVDVLKHCQKAIKTSQPDQVKISTVI